MITCVIGKKYLFFWIKQKPKTKKKKTQNSQQDYPKVLGIFNNFYYSILM